MNLKQLPKIYSNILSVLIVTFLLLTQISSVLAAPSQLINYQGQLKDNTGTPIIVGTTIQFSLYNHSTNGLSTDVPGAAGPLVWTETYNVGDGTGTASCEELLPDANGFISKPLGSCVAFPAYLKFDTNYYLGIKVEANNEASPRVPFSSTPFAENVRDITFDDNDASAFNISASDGLDYITFDSTDGAEAINFLQNTVLGNAGTTLTVGAVLQGGIPLVFEGGTVDGITTSFAITDPTGNQIITFPDNTGTVLLDSTLSLDLTDLSDVTIAGAQQGELLYHNGTDWVNLPVGVGGEVLQTNGAGANPQWTDASTLGLWQQNANELSPQDVAADSITITNNSDSTLTGFHATNTNDTHNYAGSVVELKGSGPAYTNNVYFGKYGDSFWVPSWAGNGVLATDQDLIIGSMGSVDATNPNADPRVLFQVGGGYTTPNNMMDLTTSGLAFTTGVRINTFLDEDNFISDSDTGLATQQSIKAYVDGRVGTSIFDTDADTGIQVEAAADEDYIRMSTAGSERFRISNNGHVRIGSGSAEGDALFQVGNGSEAATFAVAAVAGYSNIATFRDIDGENIFRAMGSLSGDDLVVTFGDYDEAYSGGNMAVHSGSSQSHMDLEEMELRFKEGAAALDNYVGFKAPATIASDLVWTLPNTDGALDETLVTDGAGNLSWGTFPANVTASNGLTRVGNDIQLGGTLAGTTYIEHNGSDLIIREFAGEPETAFTGDNFSIKDFSNDRVVRFGSAGSNFAGLSLEGLTNQHNIYYRDNAMHISSDSLIFEGLQYANDYSANYTNRSLVDKEYVDDAIVAAQPSLIFSKTGTFVQNGGPSGDYTTDDFVFGSATMDYGTEANRMFFDKSKAAFRAGQAGGTEWNDANVGSYSAAFGRGSEASGFASFVAGQYSTASNFGSIVIGNSATASGSSAVVIGGGNATGNSSIAMGSVIESPSYAEIALGRYSTAYVPNSATTWNSNDRLFSIGNGADSSNKSNALTILKSGLTTFGNIASYESDLSAGYTNRSLIDKAYVDSKTGSIIDADSDTYIRTESTAGADEDYILVKTAKNDSTNDSLMTLSNSNGAFNGPEMFTFTNQGDIVFDYSPMNHIAYNSISNDGGTLTFPDRNQSLPFHFDQAIETDEGITMGGGLRTNSASFSTTYLNAISFSDFGLNTENMIIGRTASYQNHVDGIDTIVQGGDVNQDGVGGQSGGSLYLRGGLNDTGTRNGNIYLHNMMFPDADGTNGQILSTDGSGTLSWRSMDQGIFDTDNDTGMWVEKAADEDIIRFDSLGTEMMQITSSDVDVDTDLFANRFRMDNTNRDFTMSGVANGNYMVTNFSSTGTGAGYGGGLEFSANTGGSGEMSLMTMYSRSGNAYAGIGQDIFDGNYASGQQNSALLLKAPGGGDGLTVMPDIDTGDSGITLTTWTEGQFRRGGAKVIARDDTIDNGYAANLFFQTSAGGLGSYADQMVIMNDGTVGIGTMTPNYKLEVAGALMLEDMVAPAASAGHSGIYSNGGELYALDASGNSTNISPHDENGLWQYDSENLTTGKSLTIDMESLTKELNMVLGGGYIRENGIIIDQGENVLSNLTGLQGLSISINNNTNRLVVVEDTMDTIQTDTTNMSTLLQQHDSSINSLNTSVANITESNSLSLANLQEQVDSLILLDTPEESASDLAVEEMNNIYEGSITVLGHMIVGEDTAGQAQIKPGDTRVTITFTDEFMNPPIVNITPFSIIGTSYGIDESSTQGFDIIIQNSQDEDIFFNWTALDRVETHIFVSNSANLEEDTDNTIKENEPVLVVEDEEDLTPSTAEPTNEEEVTPTNPEEASIPDDTPVVDTEEEESSNPEGSVEAPIEEEPETPTNNSNEEPAPSTES